MAILVTDVGTSAVKSFLYDTPTGAIIATEEIETPTYAPEHGAYESKAEYWTQGLIATARRLINRFPEQPVEALALTNQQISCVMLDEENQPVHNAILWADSRSSEILTIEREKLNLGEDFESWFTSRVGLPYSDRWGVAKALWLRHSQPKEFARVRRISSVDAYLAQALTGEFVSDISNATFFSQDIKSGQFSTEVLSQFGFDESFFPRTVPSGSVVGELTTASTKQLGLTAPVPVVISGSDQPCSMIGAGGGRAGDVVINLGSGSFAMASMTDPITDRRIMTNFSIVDGHWVAMGTHYLTGTAFRWLRDILGWKHEISYEDLDAAASGIPAGSDGLIFVPSLTGSGTPDWRADAKGVMAGLSIEHSPGHLARAVMESTGYGLRLILETFESLGIPVDRVFLSGGATVSSSWSQTITDILGREVHLPASRQATARGAFLLALVGIGLQPSVAHAVAAYSGSDSLLSPDAASVDVYRRRFDDYLYWKNAENTFRSTIERKSTHAD
ncbi:xylulokinase [Brevibacterium sanguinis]|uniref:Xylulokinase n=2 Tax=Brevibacterium TaxID=1696 RepID=A0A366INY8_9MICO|nr:MULTISPECIES: FGGY family carbohydrate kinase [Brevibacterium]RBP67798.1 xylulokinase [Brevibacterium sanguinis]RBP74785.1 xylulokinase [Brevibacterium celere]